jgi:hypothetical protein
MKKLFFITSLIAFISLSAVCQQEPEYEYYQDREIKTLLGDDRPSGWYGSFSTGYSNIDDEHAILFGARFSWLPSQSIGIGLGATGFINEFHFEPSIGREVSLTGGYGGIYIEPILFPRSPVHLSFPILLGGGGISFISQDENFNNNLIEDSKAFLIVEPSAELELNITRFFRLALGASYRLPSSFDVGRPGIYTIDVDALKTMSYTITFKFGRF